MATIKNITTIAAVSVIALATNVSASLWFNTGKVVLYENPNFGSGTGGGSITVPILGGVCYDVGCFNDRASSANWREIPQTYQLGANDVPVQITFFTDTQCRGNSRTWNIGSSPPINFAWDGIDNQVTSFWVGLRPYEAGYDETRVACPYRMLSESVADSSNATLDASKGQPVLPATA